MNSAEEFVLFERPREKKNRTCKHGPRLPNGKCPKKPTVRKEKIDRTCKHGPRLPNGKCPKKPSAIKEKTDRTCKHGPRLPSGKCPKKPTVRKEKTERICKHGPRLPNGKCPTKTKKVRKHSDPVCTDRMSLEECEMTILRTFVKETENINKKEQHSSIDIQEITNIIENFLKKKKCICYGGLAINNILPPADQFYNLTLEVPDFDFYSPNAMEDAKELANIFFEKEFEEVEAKSGFHPNTFKIFVNFIPVVDITYINPQLFERLQKEAIVKNNIHYASPDFLRMSMYLELSRPRGDVSRWEKIYKRLNLLNKNFPFVKPCIENNPSLNIPRAKEIVYKELVRHQVVFLGSLAFDVMSQTENNSPLSEYYVLTKNTAETARQIKTALNKGGFADARYTEITAKEVVEWIGKHYLIIVQKQVVAILIEPTACHSFNEIEWKGDKVKIASLFTILSYYMLFMFLDEPYLDNNQMICMAKFMFELGLKTKLSGQGVLNPLSLECYGQQTTLRDIFSLKNQKYKQLGRNRNKTPAEIQEYNSFFFRYIPKQNARANIIQHRQQQNHYRK